jgi:hypothetical protein
MQVEYSSIPQKEGTLNEFILVSVSIIIVGIILWYTHRQIKKMNDENRNLR